MTLLNAPEYNASREATKRNVLVGSGVAILLIAILSVAGFFMGHGWLFMNLPVEHKVNTFLEKLQAGDYATAYGIWWNDPEWQKHPEAHADYPLKRFTEDWTTESDWKPGIRSFHVDVSKRDETGVVVAATVNNSRKKLFLKYQKKDGTLSYFPLELQY